MNVSTIKPHGQNKPQLLGMGPKLSPLSVTGSLLSLPHQGVPGKDQMGQVPGHLWTDAQKMSL